MPRSAGLGLRMTPVHEDKGGLHMHLARIGVLTLHNSALSRPTKGCIQDAAGNGGTSLTDARGKHSRSARYPIPSREDHFDFLIRVYFGPGKDLMRLCVHRAYLDLNRTLRGFAKHQDKDALREKGHQCVIELLRALPRKKISSARAFDSWHAAACHQLQKLYREDGFSSFSIGQAQKWLNMSLKYIFALGEDRLSGFAALYEFSHIPIDNIFLARAAELGGPSISRPWSHLDNYPNYLALQKKFRQLFQGSVPLAAEFQIWLSEKDEVNLS